MQIEIRSATSADSQILADLGERTFRDTFAKDNQPSDMQLFLSATFGRDIQNREIADPRRRILIAWQDSQPVGYIHLFKGPPNKSVQGSRPIELLRLYVESFAQGKGVAPSLMENAIKIAKQIECKTLWLGVWEKNIRAQAFYKKWYFRETGSHIFQLGTDPQLDLIMERDL